MKVDKTVDQIGYRSKGPDGSQRNCALKFSGELLRLMGNPDRVHVVVTEPVDWGDPSMTGKARWRMHIAPNERGYKINFKPGSTQGEISVAWRELMASAPDASGKGTLPCVLYRGTLVVDISSWKGDAGNQETLFPAWGRVLCP